MKIISPSLLSADFSNIKDEIELVEKCGAKRIHLDVMDGHFVPNITFGPFIIKAIRKITDLHLETHLMISNPGKYIKEFIEAGSDTVIIHLEASTDIKKDLKYIKSCGALAGLAINPNTDINRLFPYLNEIDYVLVMSVYPGFGGQSFIEETIKTMNKIVEIRKNQNFLIGVDGGVNLKTIKRIYNTGIDITIVGSGLYNAEDVPNRFNELMNQN